MMLCAKFGWHMPNSSREEKIFKFCQCIYFLFYRNNLPLEKRVVLHLNKHESPKPKDALCQVKLKFAQKFWGRWKWKFTYRLTDLQTERWTDDGRTDRQMDRRQTSHDQKRLFHVNMLLLILFSSKIPKETFVICIKEVSSLPLFVYFINI